MSFCSLCDILHPKYVNVPYDWNYCISWTALGTCLQISCTRGCIAWYHKTRACSGPFVPLHESPDLSRDGALLPGQWYDASRNVPNCSIVFLAFFPSASPCSTCGGSSNISTLRDLKFKAICSNGWRRVILWWLLNSVHAVNLVWGSSLIAARTDIWYGEFNVVILASIKRQLLYVAGELWPNKSGTQYSIIPHDTESINLKEIINISQNISSYVVSTSPSATDDRAHGLAFSHYHYLPSSLAQGTGHDKVRGL